MYSFLIGSGCVVINGKERIEFPTELEADEYMDEIRETWKEDR